MERRVLQDRPIRFDWVIKRLLYRKANFNVLNGFAVLAGLLAILLLVPSCTTEDEVPDLSDEGTNGWIYKIMADYYLWNEDMPGKGNLNFSQSPDKFFDSLLSDQDGVKVRRRMAHFFPDREKGRGDEICFGVRFVWF